MWGRWTWWEKRLGRWVKSHPDHFLSKEGTRRIFQNVALRRPHHHNTDHWAMVATLFGGSIWKMKAYQRRRQSFPIQLTRGGPQIEMESIFKELKNSVGKPPIRKRLANKWIFDHTWAFLENEQEFIAISWLTQSF